MQSEKDIESDFWKDILVHLLHHNMVKTNAVRFGINNAEEEFEKFRKNHPLANVEIQKSQSYISWETSVTKNINVRLFIQNQVKVSLIQKLNNESVKIADAKFPNNPFEEIEQLLQNKDKYEREIEGKIIKNTHVVMQQKITGEFIKALLMKKYSNSDFIWDIYPKDTENFTLIIKNKGNAFEKNISMKNFVSDIENLEI